MSALLQMSGVRARRGDLRLGPVDLAVAAGEIVAIVGPNGAGKSSLLAVATGELRTTEGACRLGGDDPVRLSRAEVARRVAHVRQGGAARLPLTVLELVLHGRWVHLTGLRFPGAADLELARRALERCQVAELQERDVRSLSGGEMQRVLLAKALAQGSPLLLLDEPSSNLDLAQRVRLVRLLEDLAKGEGRGCLVVSHDLELVADACDRMAVLAGGRVLASGAPDEVLASSALEDAHGVGIVAQRHGSDGSWSIRPRA